MECRYCGYKWKAKVDNPKACPRCKTRFDYMKPNIKSSKVE